jgi:hypothetical protein
MRYSAVAPVTSPICKTVLAEQHWLNSDEPAELIICVTRNNWNRSQETNDRMLFDLPESPKYKVLEFSDGFRIDAPDRNSVQVDLRSTEFRIHCDGKWERNSLIEFHSMLDRIAWLVMRDWSPPLDAGKPWPGIKRWAVGNTRRAIAGHLHKQWLRLLQMADPNVVAVQRAVFAATFGSAEITLSDQFYKNRYLVDDVIHYRAAAIAARHIHILAREKQRSRILSSPLITQLKDFAAQQGGRATIGVDFPDMSEELQLQHLSNWLNLFSQGDAYTSLRKTLMNLPGGVSSGLLMNLADLRLMRPVYKRLELIVLLLWRQHSCINEKVFQFANADRIQVAIQMTGKSVGRRLRTRSTSDIAWFVQQLATYPETHHGNIVGLAEKAIRFQRAEAERRTQEIRRQFGAAAKVARPSIGLPEAAEIRFLGTPCEIYEEGVRMSHCVDSLIPSAMNGDTYLFHIEKYGSSATAQIDSNGEVIQANGPENQDNRACVWARRVLGQWGTQLRKQSCGCNQQSSPAA